MEKEKIKIVLDWSTSNRIKNIQKFLGLTNYYRQFIKDFASIARLVRFKDSGLVPFLFLFYYLSFSYFHFYF